MNKAFKHPYQDREYRLLEDGQVEVREIGSGQTGIFALGGRWVSGELREADPHFVRYVYDCSTKVAAIAPTLRS